MCCKNNHKPLVLRCPAKELTSPLSFGNIGPFQTLVGGRHPFCDSTRHVLCVPKIIADLNIDDLH